MDHRQSGTPCRSEEAKTQVIQVRDDLRLGGGVVGRGGPRSLRGGGLGNTPVKRGVVSYDQQVSLRMMSIMVYSATHPCSGSLLLPDIRTLARWRDSENPGSFSGLLPWYRAGLDRRHSTEPPNQLRRSQRRGHGYCYRTR